MPDKIRPIADTDMLVVDDVTGAVKGIAPGGDQAKGATFGGTPGSGSVAVQDEGTQVVASAARLNFRGAGVTVTDAGGGQADVSIPGDGNNVFLAAPANIRTFRASYPVWIWASNSQTGITVRYGEGNRQRIVIRNPVGSPGNLLVGYVPDPQNHTNSSNPSTFTALAPGNEIVDFYSAGQWQVKSDQPTGSVPAGLYAEIEVETTV